MGTGVTVFDGTPQALPLPPPVPGYPERLGGLVVEKTGYRLLYLRYPRQGQIWPCLFVPGYSGYLARLII
jgi:hypothetical protein